MKNKVTKKFFWILIGLLAISLSMSSAMAKESPHNETDPNKIPGVQVTVDSEIGTERVTFTEYKPVAYDSMPLYTSRAAAAACLRNAMKNREAYVEFRYEIPGAVTSDRLLEELRAVFRAAKVHTGVPDEGDYLEWHYARAGFSAYEYYYSSVTNTSTGYFSYTLEYYTSLEEENTFKTLVEYLFEEDRVDLMDDAEKILYIYNLLTENVTYASKDYTHPEYESVKKYTAYGALVNDWAVCQGIANAMYYMLLRSGIDCRMLTGANHAWIIVKYGDYYYYCDPTWDLGYNESNYTYLMRGKTDRSSSGQRFTDEHFQESPALTSEFESKYPIAPTGIDLPGQVIVPNHIDAPVICSIDKYYNSPGNIEECGGLLIRWFQPDYANAYRIYRKVDNGTYSLYYNEYDGLELMDWDVKYGKTYSYVIVPLYIGTQKIVVGDKSAPMSYQLEVTPLTSNELKGTTQGLNCRIDWKQSQEASGYYVYRKESKGNYVFLGGVGKNTVFYNDTNVEYGKVYTYTVIPFVKLASGTVWKANSNESGTVLLMPQPVMPKVTCERTSGTSASISWNPAGDADGYEITIIGYGDDSRADFVVDEASGKTKWTMNGFTLTKGADKSGKSYTVTGLNTNRIYLVLVHSFVYTKSGQTVGSYSEDADWIVLRNAAKEAKLTSLAATGPNSVKLTWQAPSKETSQAAPVTETVKYEVYRSMNGTDFTKISTQSATSFSDSGLKEDTTYYYKIIARYENSRHLIYGMSSGTGKVLTDPDMNIAPSSLKAPDNLTASAGNSGIVLKWNEIRKATEYRIYRKPENGSWAWCSNVSAGTLTYTDTKAIANETYTYLIYAAYNKNGVTVKSPQSKQVSAKLSLNAASNVTARFSAGKITVTWNKSTGASGYYFYRSVNGGSYKYVGNRTQTSYTDSDVEYGTSYSYVVVAYSQKSDGTIVKATNSLVTCKPELSTPVCTKISRLTTTSAQLTWKACTGAGGYYVYRALPGEKYAFVGGTTKTTYTDKTLTAGKEYFYKVVAFVKNASGTEVKSGYSACVKTNSMKPAFTSITSTGTTSIRLNWNKVNGATKYYVYQSDGSGYSYVGETTALSYTATGLKKGTVYYYKITAVVVSGDSVSEGLLSDFGACKTKS